MGPRIFNINRSLPVQEVHRSTLREKLPEAPRTPGRQCLSPPMRRMERAEFPKEGVQKGGQAAMRRLRECPMDPERTYMLDSLYNS